MNNLSLNRTRDLSEHERASAVPQPCGSPRPQQLRALRSNLQYAVLVASVFAANAMAQGGGQGTGDAVEARMTSTSSMVQTIIFAIAGAVFAGAGVWHCIGIATGHKKWSDLGNVTGAMMAGGLITALITWLWT